MFRSGDHSGRIGIDLDRYAAYRTAERIGDLTDRMSRGEYGCSGWHPAKS